MKHGIVKFISNTYHEHEQQQHQQRQHGLCDWGRFNGPPIFGVPRIVAPPLPCEDPRSRQLLCCNSDTLQDILRRNQQYCVVTTNDPIVIRTIRMHRIREINLSAIRQITDPNRGWQKNHLFQISRDPCIIYTEQYNLLF